MNYETVLQQGNDNATFVTPPSLPLACDPYTSPYTVVSKEYLALLEEIAEDYVKRQSFDAMLDLAAALRNAKNA